MKTKVLFISLISGVLGSTLFAESIDEEIKRIEKENRLLELKQQQEKLKEGVESVISDVKEQVKDLSKASNKSGFLIGAEAVLGGADYYRLGIGDKRNFNYTENNIAFDGGLLLGYQKYFGLTARHGLRVTAHVSSGVGYFFKSFFEKGNIQHNFIPLKTGLELSYLWDFFEEGNHTLGLKAGLGYEVDLYLGNLRTISNIDFSFNNTFETNLLIHGVSPLIGLQYILRDQHIFGFTYKLDFLASKRKNFEDSFDYSLTTQSYLVANYAYKF